MRRLSPVVVGIILAAVAARAVDQVDQATIDEAKRKLAEKKASRPPTTGPATKPAAATKPTTPAVPTFRVCAGAATPIRLFWESREARKQAEIDRLDQSLPAWKRQPRKQRDIRARIAEIKKAEFIILPLVTFGVDDIGTVYFDEVAQVVDERTAIIRVRGVYGGDSTSTSMTSASKDVWVTGIDTKKLVDDAAISRRVDVFFSGTKTFTTATGAARTILQGQLFEMSSYLEPGDPAEEAKAVTAPPPAKKQPQPNRDLKAGPPEGKRARR
jgi:hypothetical protein